MASCTMDSRQAELWTSLLIWGIFEAIKTLSSHRAPRCGKHQLESFLRSLFEQRLEQRLNEERKNKNNGTFATAHFRVYLSFALLVGNYKSLSDRKKNKVLYYTLTITPSILGTSNQTPLILMASSTLPVTWMFPSASRLATSKV